MTQVLGVQAPKESLLDLLPDPMKLDPIAIGFIMLLVVVLYVYLRFSFFKPYISLMDHREAEMNSGAEAKAKAMAMVETRQGEYNASLKELRVKAFAHRKALADAASVEKLRIVESARTQAQATREEALAALRSSQEAAKADLVAQVDSLSEVMARQLMAEAKV